MIRSGGRDIGTGLVLLEPLHVWSLSVLSCIDLGGLAFSPFEGTAV